MTQTAGRLPKASGAVFCAKVKRFMSGNSPERTSSLHIHGLWCRTFLVTLLNGARSRTVLCPCEQQMQADVRKAAMCMAALLLW
mmetsp:Transcript_131931/g.239925  ORF Transcript_131931/g.239925 Transcript_131931/m.239925 type:complete len:84 (+) Transcript_131931:447-698(+)